MTMKMDKSVSSFVHVGIPPVQSGDSCSARATVIASHPEHSLCHMVSPTCLLQCDRKEHLQGTAMLLQTVLTCAKMKLMPHTSDEHRKGSMGVGSTRLGKKTSMSHVDTSRIEVLVIRFTPLSVSILEIRVERHNMLYLSRRAWTSGQPTLSVSKPLLSKDCCIPAKLDKIDSSQRACLLRRNPQYNDTAQAVEK